MKYWDAVEPNGYLLLRAGVKPMGLHVEFDHKQRKFYQANTAPPGRPRPILASQIDDRAVAEAIAYSITKGRQ